METLTILVAVIGMTIVGLLVLFAYRQGIKDGQKVAKDEPIIKEVFKKAKKVEPMQDDLVDGYSNIMSYDGKVTK